VIADGEMRDAKFTADILVRKAADNAESNFELAVSQSIPQGGGPREIVQRWAIRVFLAGGTLDFDAGRRQLLDTRNRVLIIRYQNEES